MNWCRSIPKRAIYIVGTILLIALPASAQERPKDGALVDEVVVVPVQDHRISVLLTHRAGETKFTRAVALFPGEPGRGNLRAENGEIQYDNQRGNFLVRARRHFLEPGVLAVVVDAPSDQQSGLFTHAFRASERYGQDIKAMIAAITKRFGAMDWTFIGHSEGVVSAAHAARMLPSEARRVALASSLTSPNYQGAGLTLADAKKINVPILWVHHKNDPCRFTSYSRAKDFAGETRSPLLTVTGSKGSRGEACKPYTEHGFVGMEQPTIKAINEWIRTGQPPTNVSD